MFLNNLTFTHLKHNVSCKCNLRNVDSNGFPPCNMFMFDVISGLSSGCRPLQGSHWSGFIVVLVFGISDAYMFWLLSSPEHIDSSSFNILSILDVFLSVTCPLYVFPEGVILLHCFLPISIFSFCGICVVSQTECLPAERFSQNDFISLKFSALCLYFLFGSFLSCPFRSISVQYPPVLVFFNSSTQKKLNCKNVYNK